MYSARFSVRVEDPYLIPRILSSLHDILKEIQCHSYKRESWVLGLCRDSVLVKAYTPLDSAYTPSPGSVPREIVLILESENPAKIYSTAVYIVESLTRDYRGVVGVIVAENGGEMGP